MSIYLSFCDSMIDPTYSNADNCALVMTTIDHEAWSGNNPCKADNPDSIRVPLIPKSESEIRTFCAIMGWEFIKDKSGKPVIYPKVG